jgi:protein-tyrosine phosphatase
MKVLFVCMGNICRSPTAEAVFRQVVAAAAPEGDWHIDSAGTHAYHVGEPPDPRSIAAARRRGVDMSRLRARVFERDDFDRFDLVLAMDEDNLAHLAALRPTGARAELRLLLDYAPDAGRRSVPDPYYGGTSGFEDVLDLVELAAEGLLAALDARRTR